MKDEDLIKQFEFYSNAIIGFFIVQGLTFCYQFGGEFGKILKNYKYLSYSLSGLLLVVLFGGFLLTHLIGKSLIVLNMEQQLTIRNIYIIKKIIIVLFGIIPLILTIFFAILFPN